MPTKRDYGFTIIEVAIASIIFFLFLSVISEIFALSAKRTFKERELETNLFCTMATMYEYSKKDSVGNIPKWEADNREEDVILEVENHTDTSKQTYRAELKILKSENCFEEMLVGIKLLERIK